MNKVFHSNRLVFLGVVLGIFGLFAGLRIFSANLRLDFPNHIHDFLTLTESILIESLPFVLLGIFISIIVQVWLPANLFSRFTPKNGWLRRIYISCFGIFLPVCECGNLPLARGLIAKKFSPAESLTFLLAAPIINPITLLTTHQAFQTDPLILLARAVGALIIANVIGWLYSCHPDQNSLLTPQFIATCQPAAHHHSKMRQSFELFHNELRSILPALFIGACTAGIIQVFVPRSVLFGIGNNALISIIVMMVLAFIVAICSNVDAFFALAFSSTFSVGSIVAFLTFGPMIDVKMLSLMSTTYMKRTLIQITILVALMSFALGLVVNYAFQMAA